LRPSAISLTEAENFGLTAESDVLAEPRVFCIARFAIRVVCMEVIGPVFVHLHGSSIHREGTATLALTEAAFVFCYRLRKRRLRRIAAIHLSYGH
jgi:hypothetical protein